MSESWTLENLIKSGGGDSPCLKVLQLALLDRICDANAAVKMEAI